MSPFANQQELWLTGHLTRMTQNEKATKIQAVARGFLLRRKQEKERNAIAVIDDAIRRLQVPKEPVSVIVLMRHLRLDYWADTLPSAFHAVQDPNARAQRDACIWHAGIALRLTGQGQYVQDLQWADYHERYSALQMIQAIRLQNTEPEPAIQPSFWARFTKMIWG